MQKHDEALDFAGVLSAELAEIAKARAAAGVTPHEAGIQRDGGDGGDPYQQARNMDLAGLAFSGGGIRSATFNLGILQGLAQKGLLPMFDYLSTVSGGGYIGSWFSAWIERERSLDKVSRELGSERTSETHSLEPDPVHFLRKYSNYLTPRIGMLTADTWALIAIYLRNLTLNLLTITSFFLAVFLVPRLAVWYVSGLVKPDGGATTMLFLGAMLLLAMGVFFISLNQAYWSVRKQLAPDRLDYPLFTRQGSVLLFAALPLVLSSWCGGVWLWHVSAKGALAWSHAGFFLLAILIAWLAGSLAAYIYGGTLLSEQTAEISRLRSAIMQTTNIVGKRLKVIMQPGSRIRHSAFLLCAVLVTFAGVGLMYALSVLFRGLHREASWLWDSTAIAPALVATVYMTMGTLLIGLLGKELPDESREWWSRLGGWLIIFTALWAVLSIIAFYSLPVVAWATTLISSGWLVSTLSGVMLGKSSATGGTKQNKWIEIAARIAPYLFIIGLLMFLSFLTSSILVWTTDGWETFWSVLWLNRNSLDELTTANYLIMNETLDLRLLWMFLAGTGVAALLSWRIDVNQFSIHLLYRNRLVRGFLGASNTKRKGQPFTGFDPNDDLKMANLGSNRPYPIVNAALNIVKGKELAWQTRKAASFMFTPLFSGYASMPSKGRPQQGCYRRTADCAQPEGLFLGTAMAISGAAASPNMGYHSSPTLAFLLTVFNVRLGWWSGNPRYPSAWREPGPMLGIKYLIKELFGLADDESAFVYLSDGGHFENLGIYELIKRQCKLIVACDAGQDKDMKFDDLGNAIRKARVDLGVEITIDPGPIRDGKKHCALGEIVYQRPDGTKERGDLIYIKASLCKQEPVDVLNYGSLHTEFPHQTTVDQWFDESQFESYRMLGLHTIREICSTLHGGERKELVREVEQYIAKV